MSDDREWMAKAIALGEDARGQSAPNPNVGCVIVSSSGRIVGKGATAAGGRPHAEAVALGAAGKRAAAATVYATLEPCAHASDRGPACTDLLLEAQPARVVIALKDPDPRTSGKGIRRLRRAGIEVTLGVKREAARRSLSGWLTRFELGRPRITLKLALSIDGKIALPSGESKWITGEDARRHVHLERAHSDMILVGRGTYMTDEPKLDVRLPGLEERSPRRVLLTRGGAVDGWEILRNPADVRRLHDVNDLLVEGGSATATAFLSEDLVDRILIYRAPIIVGDGTYMVDEPRLDVRLPGLEERSPRRALLTRGEAVGGWEMLRNPRDVCRLHDVNDLLVEGGSSTATAFLTEDLVDRILIYRAPIIVGEGKSSFGYVGLDAVADAHGRWKLVDEQRLGVDRLEVYERVRAD